MLRLCIVGASHAVALRDAYPAMAEECLRRGIQVSFFAHKLQAASFQDGVLSIAPPSDDNTRATQLRRGSLSEVVLAQQDAFAVVGIGLFRLALQLYAVCRAESHAPADATRQAVSDRCFETALAGLMRQTEHAYRFALQLRAATAAPMAMLPIPLYKQSALEHPEFRDRLAPLRDERAAVALADSFRRAMVRLAADDFEVVHQPAETLAVPALTRDEFSVGPRQTSRGVLDDVNHMNAAYGRIMLALCLAWAEKLVPARA